MLLKSIYLLFHLIIHLEILHFGKALLFLQLKNMILRKNIEVKTKQMSLYFSPLDFQ
jgi:hypothetical protein